MLMRTQPKKCYERTIHLKYLITSNVDFKNELLFICIRSVKLAAMPNRKMDVFSVNFIHTAYSCDIATLKTSIQPDKHKKYEKSIVRPCFSDQIN